MDMFPDFLRLRGKTYDYRILYSSIVKLFVLPKADEIHVQFVVNLEPPIRQGQTRYPYLIMQFAKEEEMDAEIQMEEEELKTKYEGKLDKKYEAPAYEVVSSIFKVLSGKKITGPGSFQRYASPSLSITAFTDNFATATVDTQPSRPISAPWKGTSSSWTSLCFSSARTLCSYPMQISAKCGLNESLAH